MEINYKRKRPEAQKHIVINCTPPLLLDGDAVPGVQRGPQQVAALGVRLERRLGLVAADHAVVPLLTNHSSAQRVGSSASKSCIRMFVITEKAPIRALY